MTMRPCGILVLGATLLIGVSGCMHIETAPLSRESAAEMLGQGLAALGATGSMVVAAEIGQQMPEGLSAAESLGSLEAWIQTEMPCAVVLQELPLSRLTIQFEGAGSGCVYAEANLGGGLMTRWLPREQGSWEVELTPEGFGAGPYGLQGNLFLREEAEGDRLLLDLYTGWTADARSMQGSGTIELNRGGGPSQLASRSLFLDLSWYDGSNRWELLGQDVWVAPGRSAPTAGTIGMADPVGRVATIEFEQFASGTTRATFSGVRDPWTFEINPSGQIL